MILIAKGVRHTTQVICTLWERTFLTPEDHRQSKMHAYQALQTLPPPPDNHAPATCPNLEAIVAHGRADESI